MEVFYATKAREDHTHWERKNKGIVDRLLVTPDQR